MKFKIGDIVRLNPNKDWNDIYVYSFPSRGPLTGRITSVHNAEITGEKNSYHNCLTVKVIFDRGEHTWYIPESFLMEEVKK